VSRNGEPVALLYPQKRTYLVQQNSMTEASIDSGFFRDLYVALGEPIDNSGGAWALRIYYKPMVFWIWFGPALMALGGLLSTLDRRYRMASRKQAAVAASSGAERA
jgi:cytochrome c-type biogenesis protein CcmF